MSDRREVLRGGLLFSAFPLFCGSGRSALAAGFPSFTGLRLSRVIYDSLIPQSRTFASQAKRYRLPLLDIKGDVTDLWYNDLYGLWRRGPTAIAGLTASRTLFCLERLAWDAGLSVRFRVDHDAIGKDIRSFRSRVAHPRAASSTRFGDDSKSWAVAMAQRIAAYDRRRAIPPVRHLTSGFIRSARNPTESLTAWVIAPASKG